MLQSRHLLISRTFDEALKARRATCACRERLQMALSHQLTAHSVAGEHLIDPALAMAGLVPEFDQRHLGPTHATVQHARQGAEGYFYPRRQQTLDAARQRALAAACKTRFDSV